MIASHTISPDAEAAAWLAGLGTFWAVSVIAIIVLWMVMMWRIATKAGYPGALSLLLLVPGFGFVAIIAFAFSKWPVERRAESAPVDAATFGYRW